MVVRKATAGVGTATDWATAVRTAPECLWVAGLRRRVSPRAVPGRTPALWVSGWGLPTVPAVLGRVLEARGQTMTTMTLLLRVERAPLVPVPWAPGPDREVVGL